MADDYDDGSAEIFTAVVSIVILIGLFAYLIYAGVIRDWITGGSAVGILIVYVAISMSLAPWVIASGPTKSQSGYDQSNYDRRNYDTRYAKGKIPPMGYLFGAIMPGYFIGKTVVWLFSLILGGSDSKDQKKK